jgi:predicted nucleotidyltransferase
MRFHNIIEEIFSSKAKIAVIKNITRFPDKKFSGRELSRLVNLSPSRTLEVLNLFHKYALVNRIRIGNTIEWSFNKQSFVAKELKRILELDRKVLKSLKATIKGALYPNESVLMAALFGSVARAEEKPDSDIDLFVLVKEERDKPKVTEAIHELNMATLPIYGNVISEVIYSQAELERKRDSKFVKQLFSEGVILFRRDGCTV